MLFDISSRHGQVCIWEFLYYVDRSAGPQKPTLTSPSNTPLPLSQCHLMAPCNFARISILQPIKATVLKHINAS